MRAAGQGHGSGAVFIPLLADGTGQRLNPKPSAQGPLTATVVGAGGQEIHMDALGRIRIRFDFQGQPGQGPDTSAGSTWVRVLQRHAGAGNSPTPCGREAAEDAQPFARSSDHRPSADRAKQSPGLIDIHIRVSELAMNSKSFDEPVKRAVGTDLRGYRLNVFAAMLFWFLGAYALLFGGAMGLLRLALRSEADVLVGAVSIGSVYCVGGIALLRRRWGVRWWGGAVCLLAIVLSLIERAAAPGVFEMNLAALVVIALSWNFSAAAPALPVDRYVWGTRILVAVIGMLLVLGALACIVAL